MKAIYDNHYLTDMDVANYARQSFADVAVKFTEFQNHKLIQFLARGMASGDWEKLIDQMIGFTDGTLDRPKAKALAVYLRSIPEQ